MISVSDLSLCFTLRGGDKRVAVAMLLLGICAVLRYMIADTKKRFDVRLDASWACSSTIRSREESVCVSPGKRNLGGRSRNRGLWLSARKDLIQVGRQEARRTTQGALQEMIIIRSFIGARFSGHKRPGSGANSVTPHIRLQRLAPRFSEYRGRVRQLNVM